MNIFVLDRDPWWCVRYHNDRHVVKMILETAQLLCTAHVMLDGEAMARAGLGELILRPSHVSHPCAKWVREAHLNYDWLWGVGTCLIVEYRLRFGKVHAYTSLMDRLEKMPLNIPYLAMRTSWPQCMPSQYKGSDVVEAYRRYYFGEKKHLASWRWPAHKPDWWLDMECNEVSDHV